MGRPKSPYEIARASGARTVREIARDRREAQARLEREQAERRELMDRELWANRLRMERDAAFKAAETAKAAKAAHEAELAIHLERIQSLWWKRPQTGENP